jgi:hypothetical protein
MFASKASQLKEQIEIYKHREENFHEMYVFKLDMHALIEDY